MGHCAGTASASVSAKSLYPPDGALHRKNHGSRQKLWTSNYSKEDINQVSAYVYVSLTSWHFFLDEHYYSLISLASLFVKLVITVSTLVSNVVTMGLAQCLTVVKLTYSLTDGKIPSSDLCGDLGS